MLFCSTQATLFTHSFNHMFNAFFQSIFAAAPNHINSTCANYVDVDAVTGTARVMFNDGSVYEYTNVSRRAIIKFLMDDARSLGKFINNVLKQQRVNATASLFA